MGLKENLLALIAETGINPKQAAKAAGLGATAVYDILSGRNAGPRAETLAKVAEVYGVTVDDLLGDKTSSQMIREVSELMRGMTEDQQRVARDLIAVIPRGQG